MILEGAIIGAGLTFLVYFQRDINRIENTWDSTLEKCKVEGIRNLDKQTFKLYKTQKKSYGFHAITYVPEGLSLTALEKAKLVLQDNLNCLIEFEKDKFNEVINVKFVTRDVVNNYYEPVKTSIDKLFIGYSLDGSPYYMNLNRNPHLLIGGTTGTGKTFLLSLILTNLIKVCGNEVEIYLSQIMKGEIGLFKNCKPVRFVGYNLEEVYLALKKVSKIVNERSLEFAKHGIRDITQWNKYNTRRKKKRVVFAIEELSFFMPSDSESEDNELKKKCWNEILTISKAGRSVGVHFLSVTQRSTATNLPPDVKSQLSRITFKQKSSIDSTNIINTIDAVGLGERECIFDGDEYVRLKVPKIDEDFKVLNKYVEEILIPTKAAVKIKDYYTRLSYEETQKLKCTPSITSNKAENKNEKKINTRRRNGVINLSEVKDNAN